METKLIFILTILLSGFGLSFVLFRAHLTLKSKYFNLFTPFYVVPLIGFFSLYFLIPEKYDFVSGISIVELAILFGLTLLICFAAKFGLKSELATLFTSSIILGLLPNGDFLIFDGSLPFWLDRSLIVLMIFIFSLSCRFLNSVTGILSTQSISILAGLFIASLFGALPVLLSFYALVLLSVFAAFFPFNFNGINLKLDDKYCSSVGFLMAWLLLKSSEELVGPCCLVLVMPIAVDLTWSTFRKLTELKASEPISRYSSFYNAHIAGLTDSNISQNHMKINVLMIILATFQTYSLNSYSVPFLSALFAAWYVSKMQLSTPEEIIEKPEETKAPMVKTPKKPAKKTTKPKAKPTAKKAKKK